MRILFLIPHPWEGASSRYRVLQYLPYLEAHGVHCTVSSFLSPRLYRIAYQRGHWLKKIGGILLSSLKRLMDVVRSGWYDVVFIHLEALPIGPPFVEWMLSSCGVPIVFDFDDASFLPRSSIASPVVKLLRMPQKTNAILRWSHRVITCNDYLRKYAEQFNSNVCVIPTSVDVDQFQILGNRPHRRRPLIGWIGSHSTGPYLEVLKPVLARLAERHEFTFKIVGSTRPFRIPGWTSYKDRGP